MIAQRLGVGHRADAAATDRPPPPSTPRPSRCSRSRRRALVEQRVADRRASGRRRAGGEEPLARRTRRRARRGRARRAAGRTASGPRSAARAPGRRTDDLSARRRGARATRRAASAPALPARVHAPGARHPQVRVEHEPALEADEQCLPCVSTLVDRPPGEPLRPAVEREPRVRVAISSGTRPSSTGRIRFAA